MRFPRRVFIGAVLDKLTYPLGKDMYIKLYPRIFLLSNLFHSAEKGAKNAALPQKGCKKCSLSGFVKGAKRCNKGCKDVSILHPFCTLFAGLGSQF